MISFLASAVRSTNVHLHDPWYDLEEVTPAMKPTTGTVSIRFNPMSSISF
jgi:hypothetical protein